MTTRQDVGARADETWSRVDDGFHVASRGGEFLGYVDRQPDGRYLACDLHSAPIGTFPDFGSARAALAASDPADGAAPGERS